MDQRAGHIVAMGGGGFSMEPDNPLLDDFVLGLESLRQTMGEWARELLESRYLQPPRWAKAIL